MNVQQIFAISNDTEFQSIALEIFEYQYRCVPIYRQYCDLLKKNPENVVSILDVPFLPIRFFRSHDVCTQQVFDLVFESSGTTGQNTSKHFVVSADLYKQSFINSFRHFYGDPSDYLWLALMPDDTERRNSSLIYMVKTFVEHSKYKESGFYFRRFSELYHVFLNAIEQQIPTICIGLTYALLDFAEQYQLPQNHIIVMETGGMKGKRQEMIRQDVHQTLKHSFAVSQIHSEYGMTELLSQAYSQKDGLFRCPPWMKVMVRDVYNPFNLNLLNTRGGINVIDLANVYSCSFIETEDVGTVYDDGSFEVLGRLNNSITRGCNTMIE